MVSREKIHKLLDLILDVHAFGDADCGLPLVTMEFSNYGYPIHFRSSAGGFNSKYDHFSLSEAIRMQIVQSESRKIFLR